MSEEHCPHCADVVDAGGCPGIDRRASSASDKVVEGLREAVSVAAEELSKMVSDNARLRSALEPFAYAFNRDNPASLITVHDLRMAHEAFTASLPASPSAEPKP